MFGKNNNTETEPQYYKTATNINALNYRVYHMSVTERLGYIVLAFAVGALVAYAFYGGIGKDEFNNPTMLTYIIDAVVMGVAGTAAAVIFLPLRTKQLQKARVEKLKRQFRDMLETFSTALGAGHNVMDSFKQSYQDLGNQYEEGAFILNELFIINVGVENGENLEDLLNDFGRRSGCEDIENFANVFQIAYRRGGNIRDTVRNSCDIICDKMAIQEEIETTVTSSKSELSLMLVLPILMIVLMKTSSPDFAANFASLTGIMSTTVALVFVVAAYLLGQKILDIKV